MSDITQGADQASPEYNVVSLPDSAGGDLSILKAARALQSVRWKDVKDAAADPATPAEAAADPTDTESPAQADDGASQDPSTRAQDATPAETTESQAEPAEQLPPIEPPRSWTKDEKERFSTLPRETQA